MSAAQPATALHAAVPPGTLADPTYLLPPTCHHEECHKSYRKRLKLAKSTQACPNCLTLTHSSGPKHAHSNGAGRGGGQGQGGKGGPSGNNNGGAGSGSNHSSSSNTPHSRSHEDLYNMGNQNGGSQSSAMQHSASAGSANMGMISHQQAIQQHLQRLAANQAQQKYNQQKLIAQLNQQANISSRAFSTSAPNSSRNWATMAHLRNLASHRGNPAAYLLPSASTSAAPSHVGSAPVSPQSDSSDDFEEPPRKSGVDAARNQRRSDDFTPLTSPVLGSMKSMTLFPGAHGHHGHGHGPFTAPTSIAPSPLPSRGNSRANSPDHDRGEGGHIAGSNKHHYSARDANKYRSHPYPSSHGTNTPNSALHSKHGGRMSPPARGPPRTMSGTHVSGLAGNDWQQNKPSVEEILNSTSILPSDRVLPPPTISQFSLSAQSNPASAHASPSQSRSNSPGPSAPTGSSSHHAHLAHSVRQAFGMTPIHARSSMGGQEEAISPPKHTRYVQGLASPPPNQLAPLGGNQGTGLLPSFSRGGSPALQDKNESMEVDAKV